MVTAASLILPYRAKTFHMQQLFGMLTFFNGVLCAIAAICVLFGIVDATERLSPPRLFLSAIVFLGFGWSWMQDEPAE